jgi:hypothetical protein
LRPIAPLSLPEGATVHLTLAVLHPRPSAAADGLSAQDAERARRAEAVAFLQALIDADESDELPEGYDFLQALNDNRSPGERKLFPPEMKGISW